jgi:hypothetical protein
VVGNGASLHNIVGEHHDGGGGLVDLAAESGASP